MFHSAAPLRASLLLIVLGVVSALPALAAPAPVITAVTPPYALNTGVAAINVWGTGFLGSPGNYHSSNPIITFRKAGSADLVENRINVYMFPAGDEIGTNTFPLTGAAVGAWDVIVTNNDGQSATLPAAFTVYASYGTPTLTAIAPNSAPNTGSVDVTITGTGFFVPPAPGGTTMTATLTHGTPYGSLAATNVVAVSSTQMTCTFNVTGLGWGASSPWSLVVRQPSSGPSATLPNAFTVTAAAPTITSITPNSGTTTATPSVTIRGTGFMGLSTYNSGNPSVTLRKAGQTDRTVAGSSVALSNSTQISCTLPTSGAALGAWDVIVTNFDGQTATLAAGFTVYATAKPTVTAITPTSGVNTGSVAITNLAGTGFLAGSTVKLTGSGVPDIAGTTVVIVSATKITCNFDLTAAAAGTRDVSVTLPDGQVGTKTSAYMVYNAAPAVTAISPSSGANNTTVNATITGTGFMAGATTSLGGFAGSNVTVVSSTQITASFALALSATGGGNKLDVVVTNPGGLPGTLSQAFTVIYPAPTVTSITPPYALNTAVVAIQVWGTGFLGSPGSYNAANPTITLHKAGSTDISQTGANIYLFPGGNEVGTNNFPLTGAAVGAWDVIVTNNDGRSATLPAAFTVYSSYGTPTITSITPNSAPNTGPVEVTITGTGFFVPPAPGGPATTATLTHGTPYGSLAGTSVKVLSSTQITCTFNVTGLGWGAASPWSVVVQQPSSGASATLSNGFTVTAGAPTLTSITANYGAATGTTAVTIQGAGFVGVSTYNSGNPSVTLRKAGQTDRTVAGSSVAFASSTRISCTLATTGAALGTWDLIVTNFDGQSATLPSGFTVYGTVRPTVTAITPTSAVNTGTVAITNLAGTGFLAGATVKLTAAGQPDIAGTSVVVVSATKITCSFGLTTAIAGLRDVTVTIPDGQYATKASAFTISHGPAVALTLAPADQTVAAGGTATYTATARDATGSTWSVTASTVFSIDARAGGSWAANVYTAHDQGDWAVAGNFGGVIGTALLHVTHGAAVSLELSPDSGSVAAGGTVDFSAVAEDAQDNSWDATADTAFSIDAGAGGSWADNVYTSATVGSWTVTGDLGSVTGTAALDVSGGTVSSLILAPDPDSVTSGETVTYTATAHDAQGNSWDVTADTAFSIEAGAGGSWADNVYTSATAGAWTVTGDLGGVTGTAVLNVGAGAATTLTLAPDPGSVASGDTATYTATAEDALGNSWDATADTAFSIEAGAGGSWADNVYTSATAGPWTVTGDLGGVTGTASLEVLNTAPTAPTLVTVTPINPTTAANLVAEASGSTDTDGTTPTYVSQWAMSTDAGATWGAWGNDGTTLDNALTSSGEQWKAQSQAFDGTAYSAWVESAPVTIRNAVPAVPTSVSIAPYNPTTVVNLVASASGSTDADGTTPTYLYQWSKSTDGGTTWDAWGLVPNVATVSNALTTIGDLWKVRARGYDGTNVSAAVESAPVTIRNAVPAVPTSVSVAPSNPKDNDNLVATAAGSTDEDRTTPTYLYQWSKSTDGGTTWTAWGLVPNVATVSKALTTIGDLWKVRARGYDGTNVSAAVESAPVTIRNMPPTAPTRVTVSPTSPTTAANLVAEASGGTDTDGTTPTYVYQWSKSTDGGATWGAWGNDGATLDNALTSSGEQWKAQSRAFDGTAYSAWVESAPVTIRNAVPAVPTSVNISPSNPGDNDNLVATAMGSTDADGTTPTYLYQWSKSTDGGTTWGAWGLVPNVATVGKGLTTLGELWKVRARGYDGTNTSAAVESAPVTIQ